MMKKLLTTATIVVFTLSIMAGCQSGPGSETVSSDDSQARKISYMFGYQNGMNIKNLDSLDWDVSAIAQGMYDALEEKDAQLSEEELRTLMQELQMIAQQQQMAEQKNRAAEGEENKKEGEAFLAENMNKDGIPVTESGLQYKVIEEGTGESPTDGDKVKVHYEGTLIDGTVFDSSYERGEPMTFNVSGVIPGWTEGLKLMKEGATYRLYVPSDLAYGARGAGGDIGAHETLIFKVELLEVNPE